MSDPTLSPPTDVVKDVELAELRGDIARAGIRHKAIADLLDLSPAQFSLRINGKRKITVDELINMRAVFMLLNGEVEADETVATGAAQ